MVSPLYAQIITLNGRHSNAFSARILDYER